MERTDIVVDCENNVQDFETFCTVYLRLFRLFYIFLSVDLRTQYMEHNALVCTFIYIAIYTVIYRTILNLTSLGEHEFMLMQRKSCNGKSQAL